MTKVNGLFVVDSEKSYQGFLWQMFEGILD